MSDEPNSKAVPDFVAKAMKVSLPVVQIGNVNVIPAEVSVSFAGATRRHEILINVLLHVVKSLGVSDADLDALYLDECQKVADQIDAATAAAQSRIVVAGSGRVPPVNGHAKRFGGNIPFPGV